MENDEKLTLKSLSNGGAIEAVDSEIQKVLDNIIDPNTEPDDKREIILKIIFKPNKERSLSSIVFQAFSKLAPDMEIRTMARIGKENGAVIAEEIKSRQRNLPGLDDSDPGNVQTFV